VRKLLSETKELLGQRSWGVGILGFVPAELRAEQLEAVREFHPPFAIIAGGRPDQAASLEKDGIQTYLHVPAPALLRMFLHDGARGFIFEGRECGGHVGPRTSFVLWDTIIEVLLDEIRKGIPASELRIVFAGGIHDARSAAMVEAMAAPLSERGVRIGVLMGTAYLFTDEAVRSGAIVEGFRQEALHCSRTVLLESGPGHATRCVETPFFETFRQHKRELVAQHKSTGEIRDALEDLNIGRLRVASKGIVRAGADKSYQEVPEETQRQEGMYMIGQIAALRDRTCTIRDLHQAVSPGSAAHLKTLAVPFEEVSLPPAPPPCDVAIVGMRCLLPKAPDVRSFWTNIVNKVDAIQEVPADRFNVDLYFDRDRNARDKIYSRWGGFLDDTAFDPMRYGIPPNALHSIDPMQLLSLVVVDRAMADAGYQDRDFPRDRTSVILGMSGGLGDQGIHYAVRASLAQYLEHPPEELLKRLPEWTEDSFAGILPNVTAGRVANRFDFGGLNFTVDAACASSLAAVYIAARELTSRTSDMVIVGGVDTVQSPFGYLCFSKSQALSPGGACRPFDAGADGIAISEGITMLILKRVEDAERDGDRIYAVIKGVAGSSDGRGRSMTAPRVEGQASALRRAYAQAGFHPGTVGLIEAHGTGTAAGDAAELAALSSVFADAGAAPKSCSIGSVKSMVGHTKSAAGVTGMMKAALALYHRTLPPTLHVEQPNPKLREPETPFFVNTEAQPWLARTEDGEETPRRAGVSSFGFGGTNFHAVLEEYRDDVVERSDMHRWPAELFVWSATSAQALEKAVAEFSTSGNRALPFAALAAQVCARSSAAPGSLRLAVVAASVDDLLSKLESALGSLRAGAETIDAPGIHLSRAEARPKIAFLFPGQGSQKPGMLRELALSFPEVPESLARANQVLNGSFPSSLSSYIYPPPPFGSEDEKRQMEDLTDTAVAQPALGAVEAGAYRLLRRLGVAPDMTAGHSYGEYVALFAAGVIDETTLLRLSEARGRVIKQSVGADSGAMAAVSADAGAIRQALGDPSGVVLANLNSPRQTVISGSSDAVKAALKTLEGARLAAKLIPVACAFHSPLMQPARDRLASVLKDQNFQAPEAEVFSNATAQPYPRNPEEIRALLAGHLVQPVRFVEEVEAMYERGARIFVEVGPRGVLTGLCQQILAGKHATLLRLDSEKHGVTHLLNVLAQLWVRGVDLDTDELFRGRGGEAARTDSPNAWLVNGGA
ncbi:MAG TPA: beta-ketoacyl synthase N-terminal-like domain-containing protein, partial [Bryobacteraceae bacterium]|nr:beta-ketoacyl synthase N-terminal-like domain-containing protein [Bryobacteraceae bacterium]